METEFERSLRYERAQKRVKKIRGFYMHFLVYLVINIISWIAAYAKLEPGQSFFNYHNFSMAFFWGIGILFHAWGTFGKNLLLGSNWEERKINELMNREKNPKKNNWE